MEIDNDFSDKDAFPEAEICVFQFDLDCADQTEQFAVVLAGNDSHIVADIDLAVDAILSSEDDATC